jgi:hypothetical protein
VEEALEALHVAGHHVGERMHRSLAEEQPEHAANVIGRRTARRPRARSVRPSIRRVVFCSEAWCGSLRTHARERRFAGRHRQRITRQRAGLIHRAERRDALHDFATAAECADWHAAADDLAERSEIGPARRTAPARRRRDAKPVITSSKISTLP